jgi:hypothetical protein
LVAQETDSVIYRQQQDTVLLNTIFEAQIDNKDGWLVSRLSNIGGPILVLDQRLFLGALIKPSAYDYYKSSGYRFKYQPWYKVTKFHYSNSYEKSQNIDAVHHQSFKDFSFGIHYQTVYSGGVFADERKENTNLFTEVFYRPTKKPLTSKLNFHFRRTRVRENGGLANDTVYVDDLISNQVVIPVRLDGLDKGVQNNIYNLGFKWENTFQIDTKDSLFTTKLISVSSYNKWYEMYLDKNPTFIPNIPTEYTSHITQPFYNSIKDSTGNRIDSIGNTHLSQKLGVELGYNKHRLTPFLDLNYFNYYNGEQESYNRRWTLGLDYSFSDRVKIAINQQRQGDYSWKPNLEAYISPFSNFSTEFSYKNTIPSFFVNNYHSNYHSWDNNFTHQKEINIRGSYLFENLNLRSDISYLTIKDGVFFDENRNPIQSQENQNIFKAELDWSKRINRWTIFSKMAFQNATGSFVDLPTFTTKNEIGYSFKFLGEALFTPGVQLQYFTKYYASKYNPSYSFFYKQREQKIGNYPMINLFVNMRVKSFVGYILFENLFQSIKKDNNFASPNYVWRPQVLRFGVRWNFYDY